jgi:endonuclease/exonuclease/phosphatase family metal-dependent hydrolase
LKQIDSILAAVFFLLIIFLFASLVESDPRDQSPHKEPVSSSIEWIGPSDAAERKAHASWRKAVGPPLVLETQEPGQDAKALDSLIVVSWNTHVGGADLNAFIQDLRSGKLTSGEPIQDFVLLLQEAFRAGPPVPVTILSDVPTGSYLRFTPPSGERIDVVKTARQHGLSLFYVPLMRNGRPEESHIPEDRGNAVLSTIPLSSFTVVELPHVRQRRLAIGAILSGETTAGLPWTIRVVSVHLENRAKWSEAFHSFGSARLRQVKALVEAYATVTPTIVGGDFNTWSDEWDESAIRYMEQFFDRPATSSDFGTVKRTFLFPERMVDYLFFRAPEGWTGTYQRVDDMYGSDHYPLLGRIQIGQGK